MIRQIALALLALFLTFPAASAPLCHPQPVPAVAVDHASMRHAAMGYAAPAPEDDRYPATAKQHGCLGCAAPVASAPLIASATLPPEATLAARIAALTGIAATPALPPPRS